MEKIYEIPVELIQIILGIYNYHEDFWKLRIVSKKMIEKFRYVRYNNPIDYKKILHLKVKPIFNNIRIHSVPDYPINLEWLKPTILEIEPHNNQIYAISEIPASVTKLTVDYCIAYIDPKINKNLRSLTIKEGIVRGKLPKNIEYLKTNRMPESLGFGNLLKLHTFELDLPPQNMVDDDKYTRLLGKMLNLERLRITIWSCYREKATLYNFPRLDKLKNLIIQARRYEGVKTVIDISNLSGLEVLKIQIEHGVEIKRCPQILKEYVLAVSEYLDNGMIDIPHVSAEKIVITSLAQITYHCDNAAKKLYLYKNVTAHIPDSLELLHINTTNYFELPYYKNIVDLCVMGCDIVIPKTDACKIHVDASGDVTIDPNSEKLIQIWIMGKTLNAPTWLVDKMVKKETKLFNKTKWSWKK